MKQIRCICLVLTLFWTTESQAQYLKNSVYYKFYSPFEGTFFKVDSVKLIFSDSSEQIYNLKSCCKRSISIRYADSILSYRLDRNRDQTYKLLFNLKARAGDSFYMAAFPEMFERISPNTDSFDIQFDSILVRITRIQKQELASGYHTVYETNLAKFVDGIGFMNFGLYYNRFGFGGILYVCSSDSIIYDNSAGESIRSGCNTVTFFAKNQDMSAERVPAGNVLNVFPNPSAGEIKIRSPKISSGINGWVMSFDGRRSNIPSACFFDGEIRLSITGLPGGIYTIYLSNGMRATFILL